MPVNCALYVSSTDHLPAENMQLLGGDVQPMISKTERGLIYDYRWPDLDIRVSEMPTAEVAWHLHGFEGYVRKGIYKENVPERGETIIARIRTVRMVVGVVVRPDYDEEGRAEDLIIRMCHGLRPIVFQYDALYEPDGKLLLAPDGSFDP